MQIRANSLAPPNQSLGLGELPESRGKPSDITEFKSAVQKQQHRGEKPQATAGASKIADSKRVVATPASSGDEDSPKLEKDEINSVLKGKAKQGKVYEANKKNVAVRKFMDSLESELGISAERLSAALGQLPPEIKALPIEQSAEFVIRAMGVPEAQQPAATDIYVSLLSRNGLGGSESQVEDGNFSAMVVNDEGPLKANLEAVSNNVDQINPVKASPPNISPPNVSSTKATPRQKLNATIDELNRRFFDVLPKKPGGSPISQNSTGSLMPVEQQNQFSANQDRTLVSDLIKQNLQNLSLPDSIPQSTPVASGGELGLNESLPTYQASEPLTSGPGEVEWNVLQRMERDFVPRQETPESRGERNYAPEVPVNSLRELEALGFLSFVGNASEGTEIGTKGIGAGKKWSIEELPFLIESEQGENFPTEKGMGALAATKNLQFDEQGFDSGLTGDESGEGQALEDLGNQFFVGAEDSQAKHLSQSQLNRPTSNSLNSSMTIQDRIENINKLSAATESLAARGGGEVNVIMSPEGLGTVQVKVRLQEGKLQVQMKAENRESQKILESSLNELRHNLSSQRIAVESVKVDVGGDFTRQESSQAFSQPQFDMGRDQARQFMNQFREGNLSQRQAFFDAPGFKSYRGQQEEPLAPISSEVRPRSLLGTSKGRELNLVA
jgi:flagellar hook-length control protein FliK